MLYTGINIQRSPFQALVADLVPSRYRSLATGSVTFQMCVGAIVFLMLGRMLGMTAGLPDCGGMRARHRRRLCDRPAGAGGELCDSTAVDTSYRSLFDAAWSVLRGAVPGMRAIFIASLLLQLTFQTFTTWYALHGTERFGIRPEDVTIGFIAWAVGGVIGALPAGMIGVRLGRRNAMLARICGDGGEPPRARSGDASGTGNAAARARLRGLDAADGQRLSAVRRADSPRAAWRPRRAVPAVHGAGRRGRRPAERRLFRSLSGAIDRCF